MGDCPGRTSSLAHSPAVSHGWKDVNDDRVMLYAVNRDIEVIRWEGACVDGFESFVKKR